MNLEALHIYTRQDRKLRFQPDSVNVMIMRMKGMTNKSL